MWCRFPNGPHHQLESRRLGSAALTHDCTPQDRRDRPPPFELEPAHVADSGSNRGEQGQREVRRVTSNSPRSRVHKSSDWCGQHFDGKRTICQVSRLARPPGFDRVGQRFYFPAHTVGFRDFPVGVDPVDDVTTFWQVGQFDYANHWGRCQFRQNSHNGFRVLTARRVIVRQDPDLLSGQGLPVRLVRSLRTPGRCCRDEVQGTSRIGAHLAFADEDTFGRRHVGKSVQRARVRHRTDVPAGPAAGDGADVLPLGLVPPHDDTDGSPLGIVVRPMSRRFAVPALQLGDRVFSRGERSPAGRGLAVAVRHRAGFRGEQIRHLYSKGRQDGRSIATGVAFDEDRAVVACGDAQTCPPVRVGWATGRPAVADFLCVRKLGKNRF